MEGDNVGLSVKGMVVTSILFIFGPLVAPVIRIVLLKPEMQSTSTGTALAQISHDPVGGNSN